MPFIGVIQKHQTSIYIHCVKLIVISVFIKEKIFVHSYTITINVSKCPLAIVKIISWLMKLE